MERRLSVKNKRNYCPTHVTKLYHPHTKNGIPFTATHLRHFGFRQHCLFSHPNLSKETGVLTSNKYKVNRNNKTEVSQTFDCNFFAAFAISLLQWCCKNSPYIYVNRPTIQTDNNWHVSYTYLYYLVTYLKTFVVGSDVSHAFAACQVLKQKSSQQDNTVTFLNWIKSFQDGFLWNGSTFILCV